MPDTKVEKTEFDTLYASLPPEEKYEFGVRLKEFQAALNAEKPDAMDIDKTGNAIKSIEHFKGSKPAEEVNAAIDSASAEIKAGKYDATKYAGLIKTGNDAIKANKFTVEDAKTAFEHGNTSTAVGIIQTGQFDANGKLADGRTFFKYATDEGGKPENKDKGSTYATLAKAINNAQSGQLLNQELAKGDKANESIVNSLSKSAASGSFDINAKYYSPPEVTPDAISPVTMAAWKGTDKTTKILFDEGKASTLGNDGYNPIGFANSAATAQVLINNGAKVNQTMVDGAKDKKDGDLQKVYQTQLDKQTEEAKKAEADAKAKAEVENKLKAEIEKTKADAEAKAHAEAHAKDEAEAKQKAEADAKKPHEDGKGEPNKDGAGKNEPHPKDEPETKKPEVKAEGKGKGSNGKPAQGEHTHRPAQLGTVPGHPDVKLKNFKDWSREQEVADKHPNIFKRAAATLQHAKDHTLGQHEFDNTEFVRLKGAQKQLLTQYGVDGIRDGKQDGLASEKEIHKALNKHPELAWKMSALGMDTTGKTYDIHDGAKAPHPKDQAHHAKQAEVAGKN